MASSSAADLSTRILIVDGDQALVSSLGVSLRKAGYTVEAAASAVQAIGVAGKFRPHLLIFEVALADVDGIDLFAELRKTHRDLVGIVVTAKPKLSSAIRAIDEQVAAYLSKPPDLGRLLSSVQEAVRRRSIVVESVAQLERAARESAAHRQADEQRERLRSEHAQVDRMASLGTLAASVAHEVNGPLGYILFNLESLLTDLPKVGSVIHRLHQALAARIGAKACAVLLGDLERYTESSLHDDLLKRTAESVVGARKVITIARDLRAFSRPTEERRTALSVERVIDAVLSISQNELKHRARIEKAYGSTPSIIASEGRLSQVFLNLLMNAAQAIGEGDPERNLIAIRTWSEGGEVKVEVRDTGCGIPEELQEKIFDPFFTTKRATGGSGLGLPICHDIVTSYGGRMAVESKVGEGTCVTISLPLNPGEEFRRTATPTAPVLQLPPRPYGRILVIDDEPGFGAAVQRMIGADFEVATAGSGPEGKAVLEAEGSYDLILCDLLMPKVSGMALHDWLSKRDPDLARRMIFMTGGAFTPRAHDFMRRTASVFLEKPFEAGLLHNLLLEKLLELGRRAG